MQAPIKPHRLRGLDALRGLAALAVVLYHYTTIYESHFGPYPSRPLFSLPNGHFGVELFFCISGFVILGTIERTSDLRHFAIARFARLYPAYLVCALLSLAVLQWAGLNFPPMTAKAIAINATMLSSFAGTPLIDPSYWTLSYEVLFYAGAAVLSWLLGANRLEIPCLLWLASSFVGHLFPWFAHHHRLYVLLNVEYANLFVLGMMLYYVSQGSRSAKGTFVPRNKVRNSRGLAVPVLRVFPESRLSIPTLCTAFLMTSFPPEFNRGNMPQPVYVAMIALFCASIWLVSRTNGKYLDIRPLVFLGEISYSLYLVHQVLGFAVIRALLRLGATANIAIISTICLVVGLAFLLRSFVEKPAERWIKNLAKHTPRLAGERYKVAASA